MAKPAQRPGVEERVDGRGRGREEEEELGTGRERGERGERSLEGRLGGEGEITVRAGVLRWVDEVGTNGTRGEEDTDMGVTAVVAFAVIVNVT